MKPPQQKTRAGQVLLRITTFCSTLLLASLLIACPNQSNLGFVKKTSPERSTAEPQPLLSPMNVKTASTALTSRPTAATNTGAAKTTPAPTLKQNTAAFTTGPTTGINPIRLARLRYGLDISLWFWVDNATDPPVKKPEYYQLYISEADLTTIQELGFRHIRLSITPTALFQENDPAVLNPAVLPYLDEAIDKILTHQLGVIIDMHFDVEGSNFKKRLVEDPNFADKYAQFWNSLARHLSTRDPDFVFLEVLNEPSAPDPAKWYAVQDKILVAMRQGAPRHTLIADSNNVDAAENPEPAAILLMQPVSDPNVVYSFHFYEPQTFTGQGSASDGLVGQISGLPYPYDDLLCEKAVQTIANTEAKDLAQQYCDEQWNAAKLEAKLKQVADWANQHRVNVHVGEFGVFYYGVSKPDRLRWFQDIGTLLDKYNFGWTLWAYDDAYGLNHTVQNGNSLDLDVIKALGLNQTHSETKIP